MTKSHENQEYPASMTITKDWEGSLGSGSAGDLGSRPSAGSLWLLSRCIDLIPCDGRASLPGGGRNSPSRLIHVLMIRNWRYV